MSYAEITVIVLQITGVVLVPINLIYLYKTSKAFQEFKNAANLFKTMCIQAYSLQKHPQLGQLFRHFFVTLHKEEDDKSDDN